MQDFVLITQSRGKLAEFRQLIGNDLAAIAIDLPEIQSVAVEEVVKAKLLEAYRHVRRPVLVEDTGLYIVTWNDFPGALIKWLVQSVGGAGICRMLVDFKSRAAYARSVLGIYDGKMEPMFFAGQVDGSIAPAPKGSLGFGWDEIFIPAGADKTFAEMEHPEKNHYSMRRAAVEQMLAYLKSG